ncbi:hypothetical protein T265_14674, partial [Opisthorchis viverrini]
MLAFFVLHASLCPVFFISGVICVLIQADVFHAYQVVRKNNVPAENIITFAYDDIASNPKNPFRGKVFHDNMHEDVYNGVVIDYRGKDVTRNNFLNVLKGDKKLEAKNKKVLKSGPDDNVFLFYSGHGALHAVELNDILAYMHSKKSTTNLCCTWRRATPALCFEILFLQIWELLTSAKEDEESWSIFCTDKDIDTCLANEFPYAWITDSEYHDLKTRTLDQQYEEVKKGTAESHVMKYGEMLGHIVKETFRDIVTDVTTHHKLTLNGLSKRDETMCFQALFDQFRTHCFTIQQVPEVARQTNHFMELCKAGYKAKTLIDSVHNVC